MAKKFVCDIFSEKEANVIVFSCKTTESIREVSQLVEPFDIEKQKNLLENVKIFDAGEIAIEEVSKKTKEIIEKNKLLLILAERHVVSLYTVKALPKDTKIIVFDAHADLKDQYLGEKTNYATWLRRVSELVNPKNICLIGVRSCDEDEFNFMKENDILYFTANQVKTNLQEIKEKLKGFVKDSKVYISIDMDVFDPSVAPAVENPEPNGILYREFLELVGEVCKEKVVGMDLVEIRPLPKNRITEFLAIKIIFEVISQIKI